LLREFITMFVWVYSAPPLYLITHVLYNKSLQKTAFLAAVILWGLYKTPAVYSLLFLILFPPFPYSLPFRKKQKRNDETVSGSASLKTVCNLRLRRLTRHRPPSSWLRRLSHSVKHLAASPVLFDFIFFIDSYFFILVSRRFRKLLYLHCFSPISVSSIFELLTTIHLLTSISVFLNWIIKF
jgi:hypothetical protein